MQLVKIITGSAKLARFVRLQKVHELHGVFYQLKRVLLLTLELPEHLPKFFFLLPTFTIFDHLLAQLVLFA